MTQIDPRIQVPLERLVSGTKRTVASVRGRLRDDDETVWPSFVLLGAQRCGTTSMFAYLSAHPLVVPPLLKEVHYFDVNNQQPLSWYLGHFPSHSQLPAGGITGEASPYYLLHPGVPERLQAVLPDALLLVLLRDPVERALSHHRHEVAKGHEDLSFAEAVAAEDARVGDDLDRLAEDPTFQSHAVQHHTYVTRGFYADQLDRWEAVVGRDRLMVCNADEFFSDPDRIYNDVLARLGLPAHHLDEYEARNTYRRSPMDEGLRSDLAARFADSNTRVARWLGEVPDWTTP